jgi:membrane protein YdbS with pleckstrin-like domain
VDATSVRFKSGWLQRLVTLARHAKIQSVALVESPFDRRAKMAGVEVDTAGASESASHRIHIPWLAREEAAALHMRLSHEASRTEFRW